MNVLPATTVSTPTRKRSFDTSIVYTTFPECNKSELFSSPEKKGKRFVEDEENHHESSISNEKTLNKKAVTWRTARGSYTAEIKVQKDLDYEQARQITATLYFEKKPIGGLNGTIIPRPSPIFYEMGDAINSELQWLTVLFCDRFGAATRVITNLEGTELSNGGFFHIRKVTVDKAHKGQDLGLRMVHETLVFLRGEWNLAVLVAGTLPGSLEDRLDFPKESLISCEKESDKPERDIIFQDAKQKIARHWARMGFRQADRNREKCDAWYLTSATYFGREEATLIESRMSKVINAWKTKEEVQNLSIYVPPLRYRAQGADKELQVVVEQYMREKSLIRLEDFHKVLRKIRDLVHNKNASIHDSRVLFTLAAGSVKETDIFFTELLTVLLKLSPDAMNTPDEDGNYPLHVAANAMNFIVIRNLLKAGANQFVQNNEKETPLQCLESARQDSMDRKVVFPNMMVQPQDVEPFLQSVLLVMANETRNQLVDKWLPPRMMTMFVITAELVMDEIRDSEISFQSNRATPLVDCCSPFSGIRYSEYIPTSVFEMNTEGLYKSFYDGWCIAWEAILSVLHKKQAPIASSVEKEIHQIRGDARKWNHFKRKGGKVDYAIDALIRITQNVYNEGFDCWEYETFKADIEKHPETSLDNAFDLAKLKCLEINEDNFSEQPTGPYNHKFQNDTRSSDSDSMWTR